MHGLNLMTENAGQPKLSDILLQNNWPLLLKSAKVGTSLVAQWLRTRLPMQRTQVQALVREDPTCCGATKPVHHNYWGWALEPVSHNYWACVPQLLSPRATTTEAHVPRAHVPQQEKPLQWEAHALQGRVAPLATTRESLRTATKAQHSQK